MADRCRGRCKVQVFKVTGPRVKDVRIISDNEDCEDLSRNEQKELAAELAAWIEHNRVVSRQCKCSEHNGPDHCRDADCIPSELPSNQEWRAIRSTRCEREFEYKRDHCVYAVTLTYGIKSTIVLGACSGNASDNEDNAADGNGDTALPYEPVDACECTGECGQQLTKVTGWRITQIQKAANAAANCPEPDATVRAEANDEVEKLCRTIEEPYDDICTCDNPAHCDECRCACSLPKFDDDDWDDIAEVPGKVTDETTIEVYDCDYIVSFSYSKKTIYLAGACIDNVTPTQPESQQ